MGKEGDIMYLDERKKRVLNAIVESYISTAEPVGSRTIAKNHPFHLSSATIRNEMADLEDMGLLDQPHTSAGRIPSDKGYRYYVDQLMERYKFTIDEFVVLRSLLELKVDEIDLLIKEISSVYSRLTKYTIVTMTPSATKAAVKQIQLIKIEDYIMMLVVITNISKMKIKEIAASKPINSEKLNKISEFLNKYINGLVAYELSAKDFSFIYNQFPEDVELIRQILAYIMDSLDDIDNSDVYLDGTANILNYPEYNSNINNAKQLLEFLDDESNIKKIFSPIPFKRQKHVQVLIGSENQLDEMKNCSVVLSRYRIRGKQYGAIGVIGPTRMHYSKAISMLEYFANQFQSNLEDEDE